MRSGLVVLVVEDHDRIRKAEAEALSSFGYDVLTAANAEEALQLLTDSRADMLITDIRLPGRLNGIALARAVKQNWPKVKIAIVSFGLDQFALKELCAPADGALQKPFKLSELEDLVANLIG